MAAWLLRSGGLGSLNKVKRMSSLRCDPAAWFSSEAREPIKPVGNAKAPDKTGEDQRTALWTFKTTVDFPVKSLDPGVLPLYPGVTEGPILSTASTKSVEAESVGVASSDPHPSKEEVSQMLPNDAPPVEEASVEAAGKGSVPGEVPAFSLIADDDDDDAKAKRGDSAAEELSSSSSSSSDSDSDSDSECDPEVGNKKELQQPSAQKQEEKEEGAAPEMTDGILNTKEDAVQSVVEAPRENLTAPQGAAELTDTECSIDAAPAMTDVQIEFPAVLVSLDEIPEKPPRTSPLEASDIVAEPGDGFGEEAAVGPVELETASAKDVAAEARGPLGSAAGGQTPVEPPAGQPEVSAAAAAPEVEEPFDNSTYKNYQHHSYSGYTFADLDVEMSKYRLPQPSSGRASPRH